MKERLLAGASLLVLLLLGALGSAYAQSNSPACNDKLIAGDYGFTLEGTKLGGPSPVGPQVGVAMTEFDGKGGLRQVDSVTINGLHVTDFTHTAATGTYTVNQDCTGTFTINFTDGRPPVVADFVVVADGSEIDTVVITAGGNPVLATRSIGKRRFFWR